MELFSFSNDEFWKALSKAYLTQSVIFYLFIYSFFAPTRIKCIVDLNYLLISFQNGKVIDMPVPSSYNDITQNKKLRDFVGWVWYDRDFFVPKSWDNEETTRTVIRFESCHYTCQVVSRYVFSVILMISLIYMVNQKDCSQE